MEESATHYFVDEGGDAVVFNRKGRVIIGEEGCSKYFILGLLRVSQPGILSGEMDNLRTKMMRDPYLNALPSFSPDSRKTYYAFHAKDDAPEIRMEVFRLIMNHDVRYSAVVRDKTSVLGYIRDRNAAQDDYKYHPNDLYDLLVRTLFKLRLHTEKRYIIHFSKRGKSDRTQALRESLAKAKRRLEEQYRIRPDSSVETVAISADKNHCLQAVDYLTWAVQRYFERGESRYLRYIWPKVSYIHAVDDTSGGKKYGVYYDQRRPLPFS